MNKFILPFVLAGTFFAAIACDTNKSIIAEDAQVEKLADGFAFTEGPAPDAKGNVYFPDQPNHRIP